MPNVRRGAFDDAPSARERFWGSYATVALLPAKLLAIDAFYLARGRAERHEAHVRGRAVFGQTRFGLEYIEHAIVQTGTENGKHVLAWGFATALWQRLPGALSPVRIGVRGDALSGDTTPNDGRVSTFQPLFPNQTFFSALPAIYPTNLYDVHPLAKVDLGSVDLEAGCIFFWRQTVEDAIYQPPGAPAIAAIREGAGSPPRSPRSRSAITPTGIWPSTPSTPISSPAPASSARAEVTSTTSAPGRPIRTEGGTRSAEQQA